MRNKKRVVLAYPEHGQYNADKASGILVNDPEEFFSVGESCKRRRKDQTLSFRDPDIYLDPKEGEQARAFRRHITYFNICIFHQYYLCGYVPLFECINSRYVQKMVMHKLWVC